MWKFTFLIIDHQDYYCLFWWLIISPMGCAQLLWCLPDFLGKTLHIWDRWRDRLIAQQTSAYLFDHWLWNTAERVLLHFSLVCISLLSGLLCCHWKSWCLWRCFPLLLIFQVLFSFIFPSFPKEEFGSTLDFFLSICSYLQCYERFAIK